MTPAPHRMWQALAATDGPLPATVLAAVLDHALAADPPGTDGIVDRLRRTLIARPDVPRDTAARLAGWPDDHTPLAAAYLRRRDHPDGTLTALLAGRSDATLQAAAVNATSPALLTHLAQATSRQVVRAVVRNRHTPRPARVNALLHLISEDDSELDLLLDALDTPTAAALAERTDDLAALAALLTGYPLGPAAHARVAALAAPIAIAHGPALPSGHPAAAALKALARVADRPLLEQLAADFNDAGVRIGGRVPRQALLTAAPATFAQDRIPLGDRPWPALRNQLSGDDDAATTLAELLDEHLGASADAWQAFTTLAGTHTGTLAELLTTATGIGAPAQQSTTDQPADQRPPTKGAHQG